MIVKLLLEKMEDVKVPDHIMMGLDLWSLVVIMGEKYMEDAPLMNFYRTRAQKDGYDPDDFHPVAFMVAHWLGGETMHLLEEHGKTQIRFVPRDKDRHACDFIQLLTLHTIIGKWSRVDIFNALQAVGLLVHRERMGQFLTALKGMTGGDVMHISEANVHGYDPSGDGLFTMKDVCKLLQVFCPTLHPRGHQGKEVIAPSVLVNVARLCGVCGRDDDSYMLVDTLMGRAVDARKKEGIHYGVDFTDLRKLARFEIPVAAKGIVWFNPMKDVRMQLLPQELPAFGEIVSTILQQVEDGEDDDEEGEEEWKLNVLSDLLCQPESTVRKYMEMDRDKKLNVTALTGINTTTTKHTVTVSSSLEVDRLKCFMVTCLLLKCLETKHPFRATLLKGSMSVWLEPPLPEYNIPTRPEIRAHVIEGLRRFFKANRSDRRATISLPTDEGFTSVLWALHSLYCQSSLEEEFLPVLRQQLLTSPHFTDHMYTALHKECTSRHNGATMHDGKEVSRYRKQANTWFGITHEEMELHNLLPVIVMKVKERTHVKNMAIRLKREKDITFIRDQLTPAVCTLYAVFELDVYRELWPVLFDFEDVWGLF